MEVVGWVGGGGEVERVCVDSNLPAWSVYTTDCWTVSRGES